MWLPKLKSSRKTPSYHERKMKDTLHLCWKKKKFCSSAYHGFDAWMWCASILERGLSPVLCPDAVHQLVTQIPDCNINFFCISLGSFSYYSESFLYVHWCAPCRALSMNIDPWVLLQACKTTRKELHRTEALASFSKSVWCSMHLYFSVHTFFLLEQGKQLDTLTNGPVNSPMLILASV